MLALHDLDHRRAPGDAYAAILMFLGNLASAGSACELYVSVESRVCVRPMAGLGQCCGVVPLSVQVALSPRGMWRWRVEAY